MFVVNDDLSIYATRGDIVCLNVSATDDRTGNPYEFQPGDVLQMKIYTKKNAEDVVLQKDFPVVAKTDVVGVVLTEADTRIGDVISKPVDYWYEVTLNPYTNPQTFIGYDEDGAKIFKLFPEGKDVQTDEPTKPEDIPVVDVDLSLTSSRPVENKAIARAITLLKNDLTMVDERLTGKIKANKDTSKELAEQMVASDVAIQREIAVERARIDNLVASPTPGDSELIDIRVGFDGTEYNLAGSAVRGQFDIINGRLIDRDFRYPLERCEWEKNCYVNGSGVVSAFPSDGVVNCCYIPVQKGDVISFNSHFGTMACLVDENNALVKAYTKIGYGYDESNDSELAEVTDTISATNGYVILNAAENLDGYHFDISRKVDKTLVLEVERLEHLVSTLGNMSGASINFLGDSITAGVFLDPTDCYVSLVAKETGAKVVNLGVSGSKVSSIAGDEVLSFVDRLVDVPDGDITVIFGGTNDYWHKVTDVGGADSEDAGTFGGALNHIFDYLHSRFPAMKLLYVFPFHQFADGADTSDFGHGTLNDFRLCAKAVCEKHGVPMLDLYCYGGINPATNEAQRAMFTIDGYHLNPAGHELLAEKVIRALKHI